MAEPLTAEDTTCPDCGHRAALHAIGCTVGALKGEPGCPCRMTELGIYQRAAGDPDRLVLVRGPEGTRIEVADPETVEPDSFYHRPVEGGADNGGDDRVRDVLPDYGDAWAPGTGT